VDGDYFVHVASIGLFKEGRYPPVNFFLGIPTEGHFGTQLLVAQFSDLSGLQFLNADWVLTVILQVLSFGILLSTLRDTGRNASALIGTSLAFVGANFGSRIGLIDTVANHNAAAFFFFLVTSWCVLRSFQGSRTARIVAAVVLGVDAFVYETHFGLMGLSLIALCLVTKEVSLRERLKATLILGLGALVVAGTSGGVIKGFAKAAYGGNLSQRDSRQQQVTVEIPKQSLFQIRRDNLRPSRPFEGKFRPWRADFQASNEYAPLIAPAITNTFWYPVWVLPLTYLFLCFRRDEAGVWFGTVALLSAFVPSLVDFGFFEGEASRWLFVTAVCASICFGLSLGVLWSWRRTAWSRAIVLLLTLLVAVPGVARSFPDLVGALSSPGTSLPIGRPGVVPGVGLVPEPFKLLKHHYDLEESDFAAADWIRENTMRDDRILSDDDHLSPNERAIMIGLEGRLPAAYLPQVRAATEPSSYRRALQIERFWETGDPADLVGLDADWLVVHTNKHPNHVLERLRSSRLLSREFNSVDVEVFRVQTPNGGQDNTIRGVDFTQAEFSQTELGNLRDLDLTITVLNDSSNSLDYLTVLYFHQDLESVVGGAQWVPISLQSGDSKRLKMSLKAPHESGTYSVFAVAGRTDLLPGVPEESVNIGQISVEANR